MYIRIPKRVKLDLKVIGTQIKSSITMINNHFPKGSGYLINQMTGQLNDVIKKINILNMFIDLKNEETKV